MATHSIILAWEIPWTEESGRLQFLGLQRVGHDLATKQQQLLEQEEEKASQLPQPVMVLYHLSITSN